MSKVHICPYCQKENLSGTYSCTYLVIFCDPECIYDYIKNSGKPKKGVVPKRLPLKQQSLF